MSQLINTVTHLWEKYIWLPISHFHWTDAVDILVLTLLFYWVYSFVKVRRAGKLAVGLFVVLALYVISDALALNAVHRILSGLASFGIIVMVVIFQPELRGALERMGEEPLRGLKGMGDHRSLASRTEMVEALC